MSDLNFLVKQPPVQINTQIHPTFGPTPVIKSQTDGKTSETNTGESNVIVVPIIILSVFLLLFVAFRVALRRKWLHHPPVISNKRGVSTHEKATPHKNNMNDDLEYGAIDENYKETDSLLARNSYGSVGEIGDSMALKRGGSQQNNNNNTTRSDLLKNYNNTYATPNREGITAATGAGLIQANSNGGNSIHSSSPITPVSAALSSMRDTSKDGQLCIFKDVMYNNNGNGTDINIDSAIDRFSYVMKEGIVLQLHTTKGPKGVLFSMSESEIKWQAAKSATKRYKLNLKEVTTIEAGKQTSNFKKVGQTAPEERCLSILTSRTTLDLEAMNSIDRDCLIIGLRDAVEKSKSRT